MKTTRRIGLSGGIGSGKSTVASRLVQCGAALIDADAISRSVTAPGGLGIAAIAQAFGPSMITPDGAMDRARMRSLVFADPLAKRQLENIIHPLVAQENERQAQQAMAEGRGCLVFDIPLLVESGHWRTRLHSILIIDCDPETQIRRVMSRNGLTRDAISAIINHQAPRQLRLSAADHVIFNDGISLDQLHAEVDQLAKSFGL